MAVRLVLKSATDLPKLDRFSKVDPFCELTFHEEKQSSSVISNNQNPEWNESFKWTLEVVPETTEVIDVVIIDHETIGKHRPFCKGAIPLAGVLEQGSVSLDIALTNPEGEPIETKLHVDLSYRAPISESLKGEVATLKARVDELEEEVKNLKAKNAEQEAELSEAKEKVISLNAEITAAKSQIEELQAQLAAAGGGGGDLAAQNHTLQKEVATLKQRIEELEGAQEGRPTPTSQPASGESGEREQQPLIHEPEAGQNKKGCCSCCTLL